MAGAVDLVDLVGGAARPPGPGPGRRPPGPRPPGAGAARRARAGVHRASVDPAEGVEGPALGLGYDQGAVLVLAVELEQAGRPPRPGRRAAAIRPSTQARDRALAGHRPGQDVDLVAPPSDGRDEPPLDQGLVGPGPHHRRVGPAPEQQAEGPDQQRLARPGLPGQGGHARRRGRR